MHCLNIMWNKAKKWVQSLHKTKNYRNKYRDSIYGNLITISIAEATAYKIIMQDVRVSALPWYMPYLLLTIVALFEVILAPVVAWFGYKTRKRMMLGWSLGIMFTSFGWFVIPSHETLKQTEFCDSSNPNSNVVFVSLSTRTAIRMIVSVVLAICFCLARVATWSHYIAYTDDEDPGRTSVHFGILLVARVIPLIFGYKFLTDVIETSVLIQILIITLVTILNSVKIYLVPSAERELHAEKTGFTKERGFFKSLFRVLCNALAMSQMIAMGLLAAALWGFGSNEEDIIKTNFNMLGTSKATIIGHHAEFLRYLVVLISVIYVGVKHSYPIRSEFEIPRALKQIFKMTLITILMYVLIVVLPPCQKGDIAGLESSDMKYTNPSCSFSCLCIPQWDEYSPVCVVDTMTTYLSPSQAGCRGSETINKLKVYSNCSCAGPSGRVAPGACSNINCQIGYDVHMVAYGIILTVSVLALQSQGMVIVKSVDPRDKSIAMGLMWSVVATLVYVCGNNVFLFIAWKTCSWYTGDKCQLYQQRFPYIIGFTCAALALIALGINLVANRYVRNRNNLPVVEDSQKTDITE